MQKHTEEIMNKMHSGAVFFCLVRRQRPPRAESTRKMVLAEGLCEERAGLPPPPLEGSGKFWWPHLRAQRNPSGAGGMGRGQPAGILPCG